VLVHRIDATEAERIGLISRVVPAEQLMDEALSVAKSIARHDHETLCNTDCVVHAPQYLWMGCGVLCLLSMK
jgi:enoyl-CoA hydratase/carnithine racemase